MAGVVEGAGWKERGADEEEAERIPKVFSLFSLIEEEKGIVAEAGQLR